MKSDDEKLVKVPKGEVLQRGRMRIREDISPTESRIRKLHAASDSVYTKKGNEYKFPRDVVDMQGDEFLEEKITTPIKGGGKAVDYKMTPKGGKRKYGVKEGQIVRNEED